MIGLALGSRAPGNLAAESVFVSTRGRSLRISLHLYNTEGDVGRLFASLARHLR